MTLVQRKKRDARPSLIDEDSRSATPTNDDEIEDYILRKFPYLFERLGKPKVRVLCSYLKYL